MPSPQTRMLAVAGARLCYQVQGVGPLLMLVGHPMGAAGFATLAAALADDRTVVTYDPRGFARSTIEDPAQDALPGLLADDAAQVLEAAGGGPADVFGSSGGAVTGLALLARHPRGVRGLVAHEPPVALLLPDAQDARARIEGIYGTYQELGMGAAWRQFAQFVGTSSPPSGPGTAAPALPGRGAAVPAPPLPPDQAARALSPPAQAVATGERFFAHGLLPIALYEPDFSALEPARDRISVGGGETSTGQFPWRTAVALAGRLGRPLVAFPGGHTGFVDHPEAFAAVLRRTLASLSP